MFKCLNRMLSKYWVRNLIWIAGLANLGLLVFTFQGISFDLTPWSQAVVNSVVKLWYPDDKREETTVVLFREENLEYLNESFPVSYKRHAKVLKKILNYNPRAVFVDFVFADARHDPKGIKALQEVICAFAIARVPLYLAVFATGRNAGHLRPELDPDHANGPYQGCIQESGLTKAQRVSVEMESESGVSGVLEYKIEHSPALAMLTENEKKIISMTIQRHDDKMEIIWPGGGRASKTNEWIDCKTDWVKTLQAILDKGPLTDENKLGCPYTPTVNVQHVLNNPALNKDDREELQEALTGKSVFYGAGFQGSGDRLISPIYKDLPGVYLHSMAHDNLRTLGTNYKRKESAILTWVNVAIAGFIVCTLLFLDYLNGWFQECFRRISQYISKWLLIEIAIVWAAFPWVLSTHWRTSELWDGFIWLTVLCVTILIGTFALFHLNVATKSHRNESADCREFRKQLAVLIGPLVIVGIFIVVYPFGLDRALLATLGGYFSYKVFFAKDQHFVVANTGLVIASIVSFWPINLGPQNIIGYFFFYELAHGIIACAHEVAKRFDALVKDNSFFRESRWARGRRFKVLKLFCQLCDREGIYVQNKQDSEGCGDWRGADRRRRCAGTGNKD